MKSRECSNKEFLDHIKKMKNKGFTFGVVCYYEKEVNSIMQDEFLTYTAGGVYTIVANDFDGKSSSLRANFDRQIYKITGEMPTFIKGKFEENNKGASMSRHLR